MNYLGEEPSDIEYIQDQLSINWSLRDILNTIVRQPYFESPTTTHLENCEFIAGCQSQIKKLQKIIQQFEMKLAQNYNLLSTDQQFLNDNRTKKMTLEKTIRNELLYSPGYKRKDLHKIAQTEPYKTVIYKDYRGGHSKEQNKI